MQAKNLQMKRALRSVLIALMIGVAGLGNSYAERVEPETAQRVAATFLRNNGVRSNQLNNVSNRAGFSNLYIFNGEPGFVILAADDCVKPILGYSLTGRFVAENMPANLRWWLQGYNDEIQYAIANQVRGSIEVSQEWDDLKRGEPNRTVMTTIVEPLIESTWGQGWQYNAMCPIDSLASEEYYHYRCPTGCVATAMAQIMRYWGHPTQGEESYSYTHSEYGQQFANFGATIYNWANMPLNSANSEIAKLMYHCGVSIETDYGVSNSFANTSDAAYALQAYFGYSTSDFLFRANYQEQWIEWVKTELNENRPLLYYGGGHAFVCDGYSSGNYFHFNWGWDGECNNDYYSLEDLSPHEGTIYYGDFTNNQGAIFGIQPSENTCDAPTNLTASVNGSDITLTWTAAEGVDSYRIYRNGVMIESDATGSSYIDSSLEIGVYQYYLRSNCTGGGISDNSNIVSIMVEFQGSMTIAVGDLRYSLNFQTMTAQVNGGHPTGNLVIPSSVTYSNTNTTFRVVSIRNEAFKNEVEITALTIPNSVILIGSSAFYGCSGLTSLTIGNSVTSIGGSAFCGCSGLTSLTIGNSVTSIGGNAFYGCSGLETIVVGIGNPIYDSRENCNAIVKTSTNELVIGCKNTVIPNSITSIGNRAFYNCSGLTILTIPNSVTSIGDWAFYGCSGLTTVHWNAVNVSSYPSSSSNPFRNCTNLTTVVFGEQVQTIPNYAFSGCSGLTGSLTIPNSVTSIGDVAFGNCSGLTGSLTIPNSVTSIGGYAFSRCSGLTGSLTIPNSVTSIGGCAFYGCSGLTTVYWNAENVTSYPTTSYNPFSNCTSLTTVVFGDQVQTIPAYAFYNCISINNLTIGNSVTSIGDDAFSGCSGLTTVHWNAVNVSSYPPFSINNPFGNGTNLTTVVFGEQVQTIPNYAFYGCSGLTGSLTIPNSVTSIGYDAFSGCSGLESVHYTGDIAQWCNIEFALSSSNPLYYAHNLYINDELVTNLEIPESVTEIKNYAFYGCSGLTSLTIPNSVTTIGGYAFSGCSGLTTVHWDAVNVTSYPTSSPFNNCTSLTTVVFGDQVQTIPAYAFSGCSGLTGSLTIPNSVTSIGDDAFSYCSGLTTVHWNAVNVSSYPGSSRNPFRRCTNLTTVVFGEQVQTIPNYAFYGCSGLTGSLTIPNSVTSIGYYAFYGCSGLTGSLTIPNSVTSIGDDAFSYCSGLTTVHWNAVNVSSYPSSSSNPFRNCTNLTTVVFGEQVQTIPNYAFYGCSGLTGSLTIPNSVTSIGDNAFRGCSDLTGTLTIPNSVTSIGASAFNNCSGMTSLTIGNSVTSIGYQAFYDCSGLTTVNWNSIDVANYQFSGYIYVNDFPFSNCTNLTTVIFGDHVQTIPAYAFYNCSSINDLTIGNSVTTIGYSAFYNCSGLANVTIPDSVTSIGDYAFYNCSGLETIVVELDNPVYDSRENCNAIINTSSNELVLGCKNTIIPNSVTSIGNSAFYGCSGLTNVTIPDSVTTIGNYAFYNCSGLTSLTISNSVTSIGDRAFGNCSGLTGSLTIGSSVTSIGYYAFYNCSGINAIRMQCAPPAIYGNTFNGIDKAIPVFVPCGTQEDYATADYWSEFETFSESPYNLVVTQNDPMEGEVSVVQYADCENNNSVILAEPSIGYSFTGWYVDDEFVTNEANYDFSQTSDVVFEARFERNANHNIANGTSNIWSNPNTWDLGEVPSSTSTVAVYKNIIVDVDAEVSQMGIYDNKSITISPDVMLMVTDTLGSDNVASIIIEDGGQLLHSSDEAMATVKKSVEPYTTNADGWNLISFPLTDNGTVASVGNMLTNQYDLYAYDEPTHYWINQKDENNSFTTLEAGKGYLYANMGTGIGAAGSKIGVGTSTISYVPFYTLYKYSIAENLFLASELETAGVPTTALGSLCWYATNAPGYEQSNISIWMANINDEALTTTSHNVSEMTLVYTGNMTPVVGWNAFVFNENNFAWDGMSNVLVCVQRNNGTYNSTVYWQAHNPGFAATSYKYTDNAAYHMTSTTYSMNVSSTLRPNTIFQTLEQVGEFEYYEPVTMSFAGEIENGTATVNIPLSYTEAAGNLKGFNLVGNPFVHNVTSYGSTNVAEGCFRLNEAKDNLLVSEVSETQPLHPAEGFFVKATDVGASITFNPGRSRGETARKGFVNLELRENGKLIDRLIVKREGEPLEKLSLKGNSTRLYAMQNKQEVAIVSCDDNEQPVNFKAAKNGSYMITASLDNMAVDFLHLIDNLTGADVDLLALRQAQGPMSYTFEAKTTDYDSRFKLVFSFSGDENDEDAPFAFINNGNIIIVGAEDGATLQIVDVTGRILVSRRGDAMTRVSTSGMAPGVYALRLINGDNIKVQKIVVK